jgi:hypothetical protein
MESSSGEILHIVSMYLEREIRIITGSRSRDSSRKLFKKLSILPFILQYILSLLLFIVKNKALLQVHSIDTGYKSNIHQTLS